MQGCLSYPFFDPVLTDRAFLAKPSTMLGAFMLGGIVAALFIFFFGFVGIYGSAVATLRPDWYARTWLPLACGSVTPCVVIPRFAFKFLAWLPSCPFSCFSCLS